MARSTDRNRLPQDPAFKAIFTHPRMVADALRFYAVKPNGPLDPRTVAALDFDTLEKLPSEWIRPDFRRRIGDQVWRVRFRWADDWSNPGGYLLILVEFQSRRHPDMALRMASYAVQLYDELEAAASVGAGRAVRPFSVVAAVQGLEPLCITIGKIGGRGPPGRTAPVASNSS